MSYCVRISSACPPPPLGLAPHRIAESLADRKCAPSNIEYRISEYRIYSDIRYSMARISCPRATPRSGNARHRISNIGIFSIFRYSIFDGAHFLSASDSAMPSRACAKQGFCPFDNTHSIHSLTLWRVVQGLISSLLWLIPLSG